MEFDFSKYEQMTNDEFIDAMKSSTLAFKMKAAKSWAGRVMHEIAKAQAEGRNTPKETAIALSLISLYGAIDALMDKLNIELEGE